METVYKMFRKSMLVSICLVVALIVAFFPASVIAADSTENGYQVSQWTGDTWEAVYQHQFQVQYSTETFTVDVIDGEVTLRIVQSGTPFADVDQVSLMVDGENIIPEYAKYTGSGDSILDDILEFDNNVVIAHEQEIEISWDVPAGNDSATVYLTANEYDHGPPVRFPETGYATYEMGSNIGSITVDGLITETNGTVPLYAPYWQPTSGHPDGYTYIYVCDDEEYVYFSLDVTGDNTNEYGEDWAEISILQPDGSEKAFRIDDYDNTWGTSGFGLTSKVSYKHQTCEFAIPKLIIGNENIEFNLAYYGTMAADYYINAASYLEIQIDGDSSEGQVFSVGDIPVIDGLVSSEAAITLYSGDGVADVYSELSVTGPSGSDTDSYSDHDEGTGPAYVQAHIYYLDDWTSLLYPLTNVGLHTITLSSEAHLEGQTEHEGYVDESDDAEITLDFWVGLALSIDDVIVDEDAGNATFTVSLSSDPDDTVTVDYSTSDGIATAGSDYTAVTSTTLTFNHGEPLTQTIDVAIIDDALHEVNETFHVNLTNATGEAGIYDDTGVGIIIDDDDGPPLGKLFMVNGEWDEGEEALVSEIIELNPDTGAVVNIIPTPIDDYAGDGDGLAYGNGRMFFATYTTDLIYEIDPSDGSIVNSFTQPETMEGIDALGFSCNELYALDYGASIIHVLNPDTGATIRTLSPGVDLIGGGTFAGTRGSLFFSGEGVVDTLIYEINANTGAVINSFSPPEGGEESGLYGLGFSSSRNTLFVGYWDTNMIYEVDPDDGTEINSFEGPEGAYISALAADECYEQQLTPGKRFIDGPGGEDVESAGLGDHVWVQIVVEPDGPGWVVTDHIPEGLTLVSNAEEIEEGIEGVYADDADVVVVGNTVMVTLGDGCEPYIITFECQVTDVLAYDDVEVTNVATMAPPVAPGELLVSPPVLDYSDDLTLEAYEDFEKKLAEGENDWVEAGTYAEFNINVNIWNYLPDEIDMLDAYVTDNLPGNVTYISWGTEGGPVNVELTGKTEKAHLIWDAGTLVNGSPNTSLLTVATDTVGGKNGKKHQMKKGPGTYTLNPGATLMFTASDTLLACTVQSAPVKVTVVKD
ncbi:Calx-beta domain-containing protein [Chloroflexota bacterium]